MSEVHSAVVFTTAEPRCEGGGIGGWEWDLVWVGCSYEKSIFCSNKAVNSVNNINNNRLW